MSTNSGYKDICRVDSLKRNAHGWYVRVRFKGQVRAKFFTDTVYGGKSRALAMAVLWRNKTERAMGKPRTDRTLIVTPTQNETGVVGVKRILKEGCDVFEVTWSPQPNVIQRTSISITKHGEEKAFRRAVAIRRQWERALYGATLPHEVAQPAQRRRATRRSAAAAAPRRQARRALKSQKAPSQKAPSQKAPAKIKATGKRS